MAASTWPLNCPDCNGATFRHCNSPTCTWGKCADDTDCRGYGTTEKWARRPKP